MGTRLPRRSRPIRAADFAGRRPGPGWSGSARTELEAAKRVPEWRKLLGQFANPLIYLLLAAVVVSLVAWVLEGGEAAPYDAIVIAAIVLANAVLGYVQEARAEQAVAALQRLAAATAGVLRDGREERIPAAEVVPGDVLLLAEGDAVAADGRLLEASSLTVAEASLTGESEPVLKDVAPLDGAVELGDRVNMVFSGTAVARGRGRAVVTATGMSTEMGTVARLLGRTREQRTPLQGRGRPHRAHARHRGDRDRGRGGDGDPAHLRHRTLPPTSSRCCSSGSRSPSPRSRRGCPRCSRWCSPSACSGWRGSERS